MIIALTLFLGWLLWAISAERSAVTVLSGCLIWLPREGIGGFGVLAASWRDDETMQADRATCPDSHAPCLLGSGIKVQPDAGVGWRCCRDTTFLGFDGATAAQMQFVERVPWIPMSLERRTTTWALTASPRR